VFFKKNNFLAKQDGSILVTVLVMISILFLIGMTLLSVATSSYRRGIFMGGKVKAKWLAEGEMEHLLTRLKNGMEILAEKDYKIKSATGNIFVKLEQVGDGRRYILEVRAKVDNAEAVVKCGVKGFYPGDYSVSTEGTWRVVSDYVMGQIGGRVYVDGDFALSVSKKGSTVFFDNYKEKQPLLTVTGNLSVASFDMNGEIFAFRAKYDPYNIKKPYKYPKRPEAIFKDGLAANNFLNFNEVSVLSGKPKMSYPHFKNRFGTLVSMAAPSDKYFGENSSQFQRIGIENFKLLEKDFIGVGTGRQSLFHYKPRNRKIRSVYLRKVKQGQLVESVFLDPLADADSIGNRFFTARMGVLHLTGFGTRIFLQLQKSSYKDYGKIYYGTPERSYCSIDNPLQKFYIGKISEMQDYREGEDYHVNTFKKTLTFTSRDFLTKYYHVLDERGNGSRMGFSLPAGINVVNAYVNGKSTLFYKKIGNDIFFGNPPPDGASIAIMKLTPRIFGLKNPPSAGVGVFIDKIVKPLRIDLTRLKKYPKNNVLVTDQLVYVTGVASHPITIVSKKDIYIDNINRGAQNPSAVGIISGGLVWVVNNKSGANINTRVYIETQGERIYTTFTEKPRNKYDRRLNKRMAYIIGSVHLGCKVKNGYFNYPKNLLDRNCLLFNDEPFFSVQYRHDPAFNDISSLPVGAFPIINVSWWKR